MTARLLSILSAGLILSLTSCDWEDVNIGGPRHREDFHYTYPLKAGGKLSIENFNGSVEVTGWDKDTVEINGTKFANSLDALHAIKIDVTAGADSIQIRTVRPSERMGSMGAQYVIRAPRKVELDRVASTNGGIRVDGVQGSARLRTTNGSVRVLNAKGNVEVTTTNGAVEFLDSDGSLTAKTTNGTIRAEGVRGRFAATTSNGGINARLREISPDHAVHLDSTNGRIHLAMETMQNNEIIATTSNSSITLQLPASASARVRAHTRNGSVNSDFDVDTKNGSRSKTQLDGVIGAGGPVVDLSTSNGSIRIQKG